MDILGRGSAQHPSTTPNGHVVSQSNFRGHGKSQFHDRAFRESRLGVKENSTASQVLSKSGHRPSIEVNRQRQVHFKTLRASSFKMAFQMMFRTIRIGAHRPSFPDPVRGSATSAQCTSTLSRIGSGGKFQLNNSSVFPKCKPQNLAPPGTRTLMVAEFSFVPLVINGFAN
jgi:hypothetical protein